VQNQCTINAKSVLILSPSPSFGKVGVRFGPSGVTLPADTSSRGDLGASGNMEVHEVNIVHLHILPTSKLYKAGVEKQLSSPLKTNLEQRQGRYANVNGNVCEPNGPK